TPLEHPEASWALTSEERRSIAWAKCATRSRRRRVERRAKQLVDALWIGTPSGGLHHLPHQETKDRRPALAVLSHHFAVSCEHGLDEPTNVGFIIDLRKSLGGDNRLGAVSRREHSFEDAFPYGPADGAPLDETDELRKTRGCNRRGGDV